MCKLLSESIVQSVRRIVQDVHFVQRVCFVQDVRFVQGVCIVQSVRIVRSVVQRTELA